MMFHNIKAFPIRKGFFVAFPTMIF